MRKKIDEANAIVDEAVWADFKASMLEFLNDPTVDPKYRTAVEEIDAIANSALG